MLKKRIRLAIAFVADDVISGYANQCSNRPCQNINATSKSDKFEGLSVRLNVSPNFQKNSKKFCQKIMRLLQLKEHTLSMTSIQKASFTYMSAIVNGKITLTIV